MKPECLWITSPPPDRTLDALANRLEASEDYRVLRRLRPSVLRHRPKGRGLRTGLFMDLETTGLDPRQDEIIEIGMVPFIYRIDGTLLGTMPAFSRLREPSIPVPSLVQNLTGLTPKHLAGQTVSVDDVAAFAPNASLGHVDKRFNPKPRGGDIEEAHEGQGGFVVSGCNTPHLLEFVEHPLNAIAVSVTPPVCFLWNTAAFS